jgi:hypothetical protein
MSLMGSLAGMLFGVWLVAHGAPQGQGAEEPAGESIYRLGLLPSGEPLTAQREGAPPLSGAQAACSNCHQRSGLGEIEGTNAIPPIGGPYLFRPRAASRRQLTVPYVEGMSVDRAPYTTDTLARAIREGLGVDGEPLNYLMPRYSLSDGDMAALIEYLQAMKPLKAPGVSGSVVNFATIVTPDADSVKREAMLSVLDRYFADQNSAALSQRPDPTVAANMKSNAKRRWQLHIWTLTGAAATWEGQLREHLAREPVYAVLSGLAGRDWSPVHRFCVAVSLPCIFPNVDLPVVSEADVYPLYYSRGVLLEADLLALHLETLDTRAQRVVQIYRTDDVGRAAAEALQRRLSKSGIPTVERPLDKTGPRALAAALQSVRPGDAAVLWLRRDDIAALPPMPPRGSRVLMSGLMGGLDAAPLPEAWRPAIRMSYPVELPEKRTVVVDYALGWLAHKGIPVRDERVQIDTYIACSITFEALNRMSGSFSPDYLVERLENTLDHDIVTGYYPRLSMAPKERFASKGGYLVHFSGGGGGRWRIAADTDWIVP